MADQFAWSEDGEHYHGGHPTREAALEEAVGWEARAPGEKLHTGRAVPFDVSDGFAVDADRVLEQLSELAGDDVGDVCGDWPHDATTRAQQQDLGKRLGAVVRDWLRETGATPAPFFAIADAQEHVVTVAMLDAYDNHQPLLTTEEVARG